MPAVAPPPPRPSDHHVVEFDEYVNAQIRQTRRTVKAVDLSYALLRLALVAIVFFLAAAVVEHWFLDRGFDQRGRLALFACLAIYVLYALWSAIWPLITRSINPVFAAQAIERGGTFKNTLVNLLQLRSHKGELPPAVLAQLEQQAAEKLTAMPEATMIDRTRVVRIGYVLVAALAAAAIYAAMSPKDLLTTARRVLAPWADIPPPSRVQITNLMPGSVELMQGDPLVVSAEIRGLTESEAVEVTVVADDNELARNTYPLTPLSADSRKYEIKLFGPSGVANPLGVQHSLRYLLEAGDGRSRWQRVNVTAAPAIAVRKITYEYPAYTGYPKREVYHAGDIRGLEGTKVTIEAEANAEIDSAQVDLNSDGKPDLNMTSTGRVALASFVLGLSDDRLTPRHASYQLRLTTVDGRTNNQPARHKIEVIADLAPEVELLAPEEATREVQLDEVIEFQTEARDPDFGLTSVRLLGETAGQEKKIEQNFLAKNHTGKFRGKLAFTPRDLGLAPGDTLDYWAEAIDGKTPIGNRGESGRKSLLVVDKSGQQAEGRGQQKNQQGGKQGAKGQSKSPNGEKQGGEEQNQEGGGESGDANESKPGEQNKGEENGEQGEQGQQQNGGEQQNGEQQNNGEENGGDQGAGGIQGAGKPGAAKPGEQQQSGAGGQSGEASPEKGGEQSEESGQQGDGNASSDGGNTSQPSAPKQPNAARGGQQRNGESNEQPSDAQSQPVARDGSDDGSALERMLKKLGQGEQQQSQSSKGKQQSDGNPSDKEQSKTPPDAASPRDGQQSAESKGSPNKQPTQKSPGDQGDGESANSERPDGRGEAMTRKQQQPSDNKTPEGETGSTNDSPPRPDSANGSGSEENPQGAPIGEKEARPKSQPSSTQDNGKRPDDHEPPAPLNKDRKQDHNSQKSDKGGDQAGGGQEGGGQDAPQRGTGSSGQNTSADSGDGQSSETGAGDATNRPGDAQQSTGKTGQSGDQQGAGSQQQEGQGNKPGGETQSQQGSPQPGESSAGQPDAQANGNEQAPNAKPQAAGENGKQPQSQPNPQQGQKNPNQKPGDKQQGKGEEVDNALDRPTPTGAGATENPGGGAASGAPAVDGDGQGGSPGGDAANVEYAKEQLNLVLEKLNDQLAKKEVDRELLDELGWSEEDLRKFVDRWRERQQAANQNASDESARTELDDALRSLGLKSPKIRQQTVAEEDKLRDLNQGIRTGVPLRFRDRLRAYNQGVSRSSGE